MMKQKLRDAYARCYYQQSGFPRKVLSDDAAAVMLTKEEIADYRYGLAPYSQAQIKKHVRDFNVAQVIVTDAYVSGAAMVEAIHGADRMVSVGGGYSTLCSRLAAAKISRYEIFDIEDADILEDKYARLERVGAATEGITKIPLEEGFLEKLRFNKKMFWDLTGCSDLKLVQELGSRLTYDSAVVFVYRGEYLELEKMLSDWGFRIYEYSSGEELETRFFDKANFGPVQYQLKVEREMNMVLAVKKP
ncbi:MAG: class I SAM-dependent methyltransferase [Oscillospiraceae bacterium]|nr:class I SAM-dependent methyltransferase [Oscillospiraceae bacterium]